jgi:hypothetical protein
VRKYKRVAVLIAFLLLLNFTNKNHLIPEVLKFQKTSINYLTGLPGTNGPLLAVKIDDTKEAHPQIGISEADNVYVEQVESGLTRLLALYSSNYPNEIGPIRSARISDIDLLAQYGRVAFAYSGSQAKMRPILAAANLNNLSAERNPPTIFSRDESRTAPVNLILHPNLLIEHATNKLNLSLVSLNDSPWNFGDLSNSATPIKNIKIEFPNSRYEATWDSTNQCWDLAQNGNTEVTTVGKNVCIDNLIIQKVVIEPSIYGDKFGANTPLSKTVGNGSAFLLRDGKYLEIDWSRSDPLQFTKWSQKDGSEVKIKAGKTWIFLTSTAPTLQP